MVITLGLHNPLLSSGFSKELSLYNSVCYLGPAPVFLAFRLRYEPERLEVNPTTIVSVL